MRRPTDALPEAQEAAVALNAYLKLRGTVQGDILGSVTRAGHEGKIEVIAVSHALKSPRDVATGQASGKREHQALRVTKEIDRATPRLYSALVRNESLSEGVLEFFRPGSGGQDDQYYKIEFWNAFVSGIDFTMPNNQDPSLVERESFEVVSFVYQRILWTWTDGTIVAQDDWLAPT